MPYHLKLTATAVKSRSRLQPKIQQRIDSTLKQLRENPRPPGIKKLSGSAHDWRIRVGDYRILFEIDDDAQEITIWRIAHRRNAYR